MARSTSREDPLSGIRAALREMRTSAPRSSDRHALAGAVEMALFRLPLRQREIVRRYDLGGERAGDVQSSLSLSARQFFRDRKQALTILNRYVFAEKTPSSEELPIASKATRVVTGKDAALAGKTFARSLAQSGNPRCLEVLERLAASASDPSERSDLLLELAQTASDYNAEETATAALEAALQTLERDRMEPFISDWLFGRLARAYGHLAATPWESCEYFERAISLLRRSVANEPAWIESRAGLAEALGDYAFILFEIGAFLQSRAAYAEAAAIIDAYGLAERPRALETLAMHVTLRAVLVGRTTAAIAQVETLLGHASGSGWSSTAIWLGAIIVGLCCIGGDYAEAIRRYETIAPVALMGARPRDRTGLTLEAAHAYTMTGRPKEALSILGYMRPGGGCPRVEVPSWHLYTAAALARMGDDRSALCEANKALAGLAPHGPGRGLADAHRHVSLYSARLGDTRVAQEHLVEARRLTEIHGTPYALLRTLAAEAVVTNSVATKREAAEYAKLLHALARS